MDAVILSLAILATTLLTAAGAWAALRRGWKRAVVIAFLVVLGLIGLFCYLSSIATGTYLAGLGEMLIAIALAIGPGAGLILGAVAAWSGPVGIGCTVLYMSILAVTLGSNL